MRAAGGDDRGVAVEAGSLSVIATPIGNLEDITLRALRVLGELDAVACEDTRRTRAIYEHYDLARPRSIFSYHRHNEAAAGARILALLARGAAVGLVSNAGYPCISDPGHLVVRQAIEAGHRVEVIPGASAVPYALIVSGLPTGAYLFLGFPPRKAGRLQTALAEAADREHTLVLFEAPGRVAALLDGGGRRVRRSIGGGLHRIDQAVRAGASRLPDRPDRTRRSDGPARGGVRCHRRQRPAAHPLRGGRGGWSPPTACCGCPRFCRMRPAGWCARWDLPT